MPIDRHHAFAGAGVYAPPRWPWGAAAAPWRQYRAQAQLGAGCLLGPRAWCVNQRERERLRLGERVICRGLLRIEDFGDGRIELGREVYVGDDCLLSAAGRISIGDRVLLAHGVQILDNDSHPLSINERRADMEALLAGHPRGSIQIGPITIGDDAWIGLNAIVIKNVTIGEGSVVAAGSVVTRDIPAHSVAAGNPARVIRPLSPR